MRCSLVDNQYMYVCVFICGIFFHNLKTRMEEPCFDVLRTQLQLGYTVYCQNLITNGILGLAVTVQFQAQKFT